LKLITVEIDSTYTGKRVLRVHVHDTYVECQEASWSPPGEHIGIEEIQSMGGFDANGNETEISVEEMLAGEATMNCWGFCDTNTGDVHVWFKPECSMGELIFLLAHEMGHDQAERGLTITQSVIVPEEERNADMYAEVAQLSWLMAERLSNGISSQVHMG